MAGSQGLHVVGGLVGSGAGRVGEQPGEAEQDIGGHHEKGRPDRHQRSVVAPAPSIGSGLISSVRVGEVVEPVADLLTDLRNDETLRRLKRLAEVGVGAVVS